MGALTPDLHKVEMAVVERTNAARQKNKLAEVKINPKLSKAARAYAQLLARNQAFSHSYGGTTVPQRITATGYEFCTYSENLAMEARSKGFTAQALAASAVSGWLKSPSHRANLLGASVTETGIGVARVPYQYPKYVTVQLFARPASEQIRFKIVNQTSEPITYSFAGKSNAIKPRFTISHRSCSSGRLSFQQDGGLFQAPVQASFTAQDGTAYRLKTGTDGKLSVSVEQSAP